MKRQEAAIHNYRVIPRQINQCYPPHHLGLPWYFFLW